MQERGDPEAPSGAARFAGGDQAYLRDEQYADASRLAARARLHERYATAAVPWFAWVRSLLELGPRSRVLDAGCGAGWVWASAGVAPGTELVLCDLSPGMVADALGRAQAESGATMVRGHTVDVQSLPFASASFDRVLANHMLYHLPDPRRGVGELARVVRDDGVVLVATNGSRHMEELHEVEAGVFGRQDLDRTVTVFGADVGFGLLRERFGDVRWVQYGDELRCTDPADVIAYSRSSPPGENATAAQVIELEAAIRRRFDAGGGVMSITKDVGCFVCRAPR